ncbi:MAG: BON domain-containing protein [Gammaproteobacteria bacterium]|nr:BON domain-containing protein [Gammaproteobacteria bacterium]
MKALSRKLLQKTCLALTIAAICTTASAADSLPQDILEARQEAQIWTTFALSPYLRASDITVSVDAGVATLTGVVEEEVNRDLARQIAAGVDGIDTVHNEIVVQADYSPAERGSDERTYAEFVEDAGISTAVRSKLFWSKFTDSQNIEVDTVAGVVTLKGTTDTEISKELAGKLALNTPGVLSVENQVITDETGPTLGDDLANLGQETGAQISDSWITAKVKSTFIYSRNVNSGGISVTTTDGVVALSGKLSSGAERALAIELAQNVRGVKEVDASKLEI